MKCTAWVTMLRNHTWFTGGLQYIQKSGRVSDKDVQAITGVSKATATRLLQVLSEMVLVRRGVGAGAYYCFK